jgi:hypothetical protein
MGSDRMKKAIDAAIEAYHGWLRDEAVNEVTEELEDAVESLLLVFDASEAPQEYQALARVVERIVPEWESWKQEVAKHGTEGVFPGHYWSNAMRDLARAWMMPEEYEVPALEPVAELTRQNVSARQIALIYGWMKPDGSPDTQKVFEEQFKPGRHTENMVHPAIAKRKATKDSGEARVGCPRGVGRVGRRAGIPQADSQDDAERDRRTD